MESSRKSRSKEVMISLSVPRTSRSLSPAPTQSSPTPQMSLVRCGSDRENSMRDRTASICISPRTLIPICPQLTQSQVQVIRKTWRHINTKGFVSVLTRCFQRLESSCPAASRCFGASHSLSIPPLSSLPTPCRSVADHAKFLLATMDKIIDGEQDMEELREVGARHVALKQDHGFTTNELDRLQEILVETILKQDCIKQSKETCRVWRLLICAMVDLIRDGFDQHLRHFRRKHSFNAHTQYFENIERRAAMCPSRKSSLNVDPRGSSRKFSNI